MNTYSYLKQYIHAKDLSHPSNWFGLVTEQEILHAEQRLGFSFPRSLKQFWLEIGHGFLQVSGNGNSTWDHINNIMSPSQIADIMLNYEDSDYLLPEPAEYIEEGYVDAKNGDIIFFEIGDSSSFLVMKPRLGELEAVYTLYGNKAEESFERFIWGLYHKSPTYYFQNILTEEKAEQPTEEELLQGTPPRGKIWDYINLNYHNMLRAAYLYDQEFRYGGEPAAEKMYDRFHDQIFLNYCPNCGNLKKTPKARQCLECDEFIDPVVK